MKTLNSYSDCFYQVRNGLRKMIANNFKCAQLFTQRGVMNYYTLSDFADALTAYNEVSGLPFFVKFNSFSADAQ